MDWSQSQIRVFRALLYCYPGEFRHEYGAEMERLFSDRLYSEPRLRLWFEALVDLARSAPREHWAILAADLKYGVRTLPATPGFTAVCLLIIAIGIGATVATFSLVNAVLLRSLPFGQPERLVYLWSPNSNFKGVPEELGPNVPDFCDWQRRSQSFSSLSMVRRSAVNLIRERSSVRIEAALVTGSFFKTLEAWPAVGSSFGQTGDRSSKIEQAIDEHTAVISHSLWQSQFGSDANILGKQIQLNRNRYTVIGIMPEGFSYPSNGDIPLTESELRGTDVWLPLVYSPAQRTDRTNFQSVDAAIGRLRDGVSARRAQTELRAIQSRLDPLYPEMWRGFTALARPLVETIVGPVAKMLWLLLGAAALVLLIAVGNVSSLLFARTATRAHELGIRTALGAERTRILRQLLTEALLLSCAGGALGAFFAYAAVHILTKLNPGGIPRFDTATVDTRALLAALLLSLVTGVLAGFLPALAGSRLTINELLRRGGNRVTSTSKHIRFALIVMEVALSVVLLAGSGLLIRSYLRLAAVDPGFSPGTLTFRLQLDNKYNRPEQQANFYKAFLQKLETIPGVASAGASNGVPLSHYESVTSVDIRGFGEANEMVETRSVTPDYLRAIGTPLLRGRSLQLRDVNAKAPVSLVNESFVEMYFRNRDPLGGHLRMGIGDRSQMPWLTIVGVVQDSRQNTLEEPSRPQILQPSEYGDNFAVRCSVPVAQVVRQARAALRSLDPALGLGSVRTMGERMAESKARRRFQTVLLTGFAAVAVALAAVGLYGLLSYSVKQRRAEIGIRLASGRYDAG